MKLFEGSNKSVAIGIIAIIAVIAIGLFVSKKNTQAPTLEEVQKETPSQTNENGSQGSGQTTTKTSIQTSQSKPTPAAIVRYTDEGYVPAFEPSITVIYQGQTILFVNASTQKMWVASDPHPSHSLYPEFDQKIAVGPGGTYEFTFNKLGKWTYHNHLDPSRRGTIVVNNR